MPRIPCNARSSVWSPLCLSERSLTKLQMPEAFTGLCQRIHSFCSTSPSSLAFTIMKLQADSGEAVCLPLLYKSNYSNAILEFAVSHFKKDQCEFPKEARETVALFLIRCNSVFLSTWQLFCPFPLSILLHIHFWKGYEER